MRSIPLALLVAFLMVFAACGDDDENSTASQASADTFDRDFGSDDGGDTSGGSTDGFSTFEAEGDDGSMEGSFADDGVAEPAVVDLAIDPAEFEPVSGTADGPGGEGGTAPVSGALTPADIGRDVVFVATMDVVVDDVAEATRKAQTELAPLGALLFGQNTTTDPVPRTTITFKVFPKDFQLALSKLEGLGRLEGQELTADDVTERIVDLESQIITSGVSVERLRALLEEATTLEDVAALERELLNRETDLETLRGQLRTLQDAASLATIHLTLREELPPSDPPPPAPLVAGEIATTAYVGHDAGANCPGRSRVTMDEGADLTLCVRFVNTGNTTLQTVEFSDDALDLLPEDFTVIEGSLEDLAPEESVLVYAQTGSPAIAAVSPPVTVVAIDDDGNRVRQVLELERDVLDVRVEADNSLPSFGDALRGSLDFLLVALAVVIIVAGALLPFIWVPIIAWFIWRWNRSRKRRHLATPEQGTGSPTPPVPAPADPPAPTVAAGSDGPGGA